MKKLLFLLVVSVFSAGNLMCSANRAEQHTDKDLVALVAEAMTAPNADIKKVETDQGKVVWSINTQRILEQTEGGPGFLDLCKKTYQEYMLLGMITQEDQSLSEEEKKAILTEGRKKIVLLQRHLRSYLEPLISQQAIENNVDVVVDSYTGALLYVADYLSSERVIVPV